MDRKKYTLTILVAFVLMIVTDYLIHNVLLASTYEQLGKQYDTFRAFSDPQLKMWVLAIGTWIFCSMFVWVYTRGLEAKPWLGQAIRYGIAIWLFFMVPGVLSLYVLYGLPFTLAITWLVAGGVQLVLIALTTAAICRKAPAAAG
jgi:hypothetical protein